GRRVILLAEDEPSVRELVVQVLTKAGYAVVAAADGREAMVLAAAMPRIDGLLTDVMMPHVSGPQLAAALRQRRPDLPVLFMSGFTDDVLGERGAIDPGVDLLQKPFGPRPLLERVVAMVESTSSVHHPSAHPEVA
ncbi:MAG: response regulator, partial [Chloroflexi bacterium]|nr:response regulator [Chloroflexota bacterium]